MSSVNRTERARDEDKKGKATWNDRLLELFIKVAIQEVRDGNRPTTHLNKKGWLNLQTKFNRVGNVNYEMKQLKNKWENLKKEWQLWKRLVGQETGLGWNDRKKTVEASDEWWERKIREIPAAKFRERGLFLAYEMELVFGDVAATGFTAYEWAPSFGTVPPRGVLPDPTLVDSGSTEGSGDSDDINVGSGLPDLNLHTPSGIPVGASTNSPPEEVRGGGKKKGKRKSDSLGGSGSAKKQSFSQSVGMSLEKLVGALAESKRSSSCEELMETLNRFPIVKGSEFFYKVLKYLGKNRDCR